MRPMRTLTVRGVAVPRLGFGTWQITGDAATEAVRDALELGYRHIDTARMYGNEREVGRGLADSSVARGDVWLTTKVWPDNLAPDRLRASAEASLRDLAVDGVDLLLIHWPSKDVPLEDSLTEMVRLREEGLTREIGVSNFPPGMLRRALALAPVFCNQVEYHPLLGQTALLEIAAEHDLMITAYAPLAHGKALADPTLCTIASEHDRSVAEVAIRWLIEQPHVAAVPKAASHANRRTNFQALDFELTHEDRDRIAALPKDQREFNPSVAPDWTD